MPDVPIRGEMIRLGQLLKLVGAVDHGAEAKERLARADVRVNGDPETRRGRQLHPGDVVTVEGDAFRIARGWNADNDPDGVER